MKSAGDDGGMCLRVVVEGLVQGVCFRYETRAEATRLGVRGWVRNRPDGTVEGVFEGSKDRVEELLRWCHHGPAGARVDDVRISRDPVRSERAACGEAGESGEFSEFSIRF